MNAPLPSNEEDRLKALKEYNILDTLAEKEYDAITRLAAYIAGTPIALISLLDEERQWFKSDFGLGASETPREISFCQHAIMHDNLFEVTNAAENEGFKNNPLVTGDPNIRFYAGMPLKTPEGYNIGTLCVIDKKVGKLTDDQITALQDLSTQVISLLESRKTNRLLKNQQKQLTNFFNLNMDLIGVADKNGFFTKLSPKWSVDLGFTDEELMSKPFIKFVHPDDLDRTILDIKKVSGGDWSNYVNRIEKKDGTYISLSWSATSDPDTGDIYCVARDVTKELEHSKIREAELKAIDNSVLRVELSTDAKIIQCNENFLTLLGYECKEVIGCLHENLVSDEEKQNKKYQQFWEQLRRGEPVSGEFKRIRKDGKVVWIKGAYLPVMNEQLQVEKIVKLAYDVTDRKQAEKELARRNEELDQFSYVVSHDLKAPLRAIGTLTEFLQEDLEGKLTPDLQKNFNLIISRTKRMQQLISDILEYSKLGKQQVKKEEVNTADLLKELSNDLNKTPETFSIDISGKFPVLNLQKVFLQQVFGNLISNAIKYNDKEKGLLRITYKENKRNHVFSFQDNGIGIEKAYQEKIFQIFQTIDGEKTEDSTGIGLATVKKLVQELKGKISVSSTFGEGSTFTVEILK